MVLVASLGKEGIDAPKEANCNHSPVKEMLKHSTLTVKSCYSELKNK
jgi:hypothetical protein